MKNGKAEAAGKTGLRLRAEESLKKRRTASDVPGTEAGIKKLLHELQVNRIELEMQNEELRAAKAAIDAVFERYNDLYDFAPVGYFTLDAAGIIGEVNLTGASLLGTNRSGLVSKRFDSFVAADDRQAFHAFLGKVFEGKGKESFEMRLLNQDSLMRLEAVTSSGGQECRVVLIDITGLARAEAEVMRLNRVLEGKVSELSAANEALESFIYSISHDLRSPLRSMSEFARIVLADYADRLDEQGKDYLGRVRRGAAKANDLVEGILELSKISKQEINRSQVDMSGIADSIISELRRSDPQRRVDADIKEGLTVFADRRLIELVLSNVLRNAWKFTSKTKDPRIEFGKTSADETGPISQAGLMPKTGPVFFIRDNGAGFDPAYAEKMFLPFHRLHGDSEFEGTGIGLAIVEQIIRRHGGKVWAECDREKGTTIFFTFG